MSYNYSVGYRSYTNSYFYMGHNLAYDPTSFDDVLRPKSSWCMKFVSDEEGYCSLFLPGQNIDKMNPSKTGSVAEVYYKNLNKKDSSALFVTKDSGMTWQPLLNSSDGNNFKVMAFSDVEKVDNNLYISSIFGRDGYGVYRFDLSSRNWIECEFDKYNKVPVHKLFNNENNIYAATNGFGMYELSNNKFIPYESRFTTQKGLNSNCWDVTCISEDKNNKNNLIIGTSDNGIIYTSQADDLKNANWDFDNNGIPYGEIVDLKILYNKPQVIFVSVKNNGLFKKNNTLGKYVKVFSGLPDICNVRQILINEESSIVKNLLDVSEMISYTNVLVTRTRNTITDYLPVDGYEYSIGESISDAEVVYIGSLASGLFTDSSSDLKEGRTYYYNFYSIGSNYTYNTINELDVIVLRKGTVVTDDDFVLYLNSDLSSMDLSKRIIDLDPTKTYKYSQQYEIVSNENSTITIKYDDLKIINGTVWKRYYVESDAKILSTYCVKASCAKQMYVVCEDNTGIGSIYISNNNGNDWDKISIEGIDIRDNIDVVYMSLSIVKANNSGYENIIIYALTSKSLYKTIDGGISWNIVATNQYINGIENQEYNGLPILSGDNEYIRIVTDSIDENVLYVFEANGTIYRTKNNGKDWHTINEYEYNINNVAINSTTTNNLYLCTNGDGLVRVDEFLRDYIETYVSVDGKISYFDFNNFKIGDTYNTGSNYIKTKTFMKNTNTYNDSQYFDFKTEDTNLISFRFTKSNRFISYDAIYIGDTYTHPYPNHNPFVLQNPVYTNTDIIVNSIGGFADGIYALTSIGTFLTYNGGEKWDKIKNQSLPDKVCSICSNIDTGLIIGTKEGLFKSNTNMTDISLVESKNNQVNCVWKYDGNVKYIYRGGSDGLFITIYNSECLIVYSGNTLSNMFCWGDPFDVQDGNWSERTRGIIGEPITRAISQDTDMDFSGWDGALILRKGPYDDYDSAYSDYMNNKIWAPETFVGYPTNNYGGNEYNSTPYDLSPIFTDNSVDGDLRYVRDQDLTGNWLGTKYIPTTLIPENTIVVGNLKNRKGNPPQTPANADFSNIDFDFGPTTNNPIIDEVAQYFETNKYYIYKAYPYINIPDPSVPVSNVTTKQYYRFAYYNPSSGDIPDSYTVIFPISKFSGSTTVLCGSSYDKYGNWVVGTDNGIFYSRNRGLDIYKVAGISGEILSLIVTSDCVGIAVVALENGDVQIIKNDNLSTSATWIPLVEANKIFYSVGVGKIFNFAEYDNQIYASTNKGILIGNVDGTGWYLSGKVGDFESLTCGKILGQTFNVE